MRIRRRAVGIPVAIDATGSLFGVAKIVPGTQSPSYQRPLRCPGCGVGVEPVNRYLTHGGAAVGAYFRLAKDHQHALGCRFHASAECQRLSEDHPDVLAVVKEGYELDVEALLALGSTTSRTAARRHATQRRLTPVSGLGRPSGGGLADILRVVERFASDVHAQEQFTAVFRDERLKWRDFCFDAGSEIKRFHRNLRAEAAPIPRTLVGVVSRTYASKSGDTYAADIAIRRDHNLDRPVFSDVGKPILPVIRATSRDQIGFMEGDRIAAIGLWRLFGTLEQPTLWLGTAGRAVVL